MEVWIGNIKVEVDAAASIGKGCEADIFPLKNGQALKLYKTPDHADFAGKVEEQQGARMRIDEIQQKLPSFPTGLPESVIAPLALAHDRKGGRIVGYAMRWIKTGLPLMMFASPKFRQRGAHDDAVRVIFSDLGRTLQRLHQRKVVIGDFNDLNVLVEDRRAYLIDADSFQFGQFRCRMFCVRFLDPLLCDPSAGSLYPVRPHSAEGDWYAFCVMLFRSLTYVDPYGGIYRPKDAKLHVPNARRPLERITVFHADVKYPQAGVPYQYLTDDLLQHFHLVFEKDFRGPFPVRLLDGLNWSTCPACHARHARPTCPRCGGFFALPSRHHVTIKGKVKVQRLFQTKGHIAAAAWQNRQLAWFYQEDGEFKNQKGEVLFQGEADSLMRFELNPDMVLVGRGDRFIVFEPGQDPIPVAADAFYGLGPVFRTNGHNYYWLSHGQLYVNGCFGAQSFGMVLGGQTLFWAGDRFGLGFYRAGEIKTGFVFNTPYSVLNDSVELPLPGGHLIDATCVFGERHAWLFVDTKEANAIMQHLFVIEKNGALVAEEHQALREESWLGAFDNKFALGRYLYVATEEGIVRIELQNGRLQCDRSYPQTEQWAGLQSRIFLGPSGMYVVNPQVIYLLSIN